MVSWKSPNGKGARGKPLMRRVPSIRRTRRPVMPDNAMRWCFEPATKVSVGVSAAAAQHSGAATRRSLDAERRADWISAWWCGYAWSTENTRSSRA